MQNPTEDRPDETPEKVENRGIVCEKCGAENTDWTRFCIRCGSEVQPPEAATQTELGHIAYLLHELNGWSQRVMLPQDVAMRLRGEYQQRQSALRQTQTPLQPEQTAPATPPTLPPLPEHLGMSRMATPEPALSATASDTPGALRIFLQEHALKIVFALAAILVIAALRSMLAWEWMDAILLRLIPLVPIALTGMFAYFGQKTRQENPWAAFVYHALTSVLAAFDVAAVNKYWLEGALTLKPLLMASSLAATGTAGLLLLRWREIPYLHLFQTGTLASLFLTLQVLRAETEPGDFRAVPLWLFAAVYFLVAAFCFVMAGRVKQTAGTMSDTSQEENVTAGAQNSGGMWRMAWALWGNLFVVSIGLMVALNAMLETPVGSNEIAGLLLCAGLIYGMTAHLLRDGRMTYLAGALITGGSLLTLTTQKPIFIWYGFAGVLLALSALWLVLAKFQRAETTPDASTDTKGEEQTDPQTTRDALAAAYRNMAIGGVFLATFLTLCVLLPMALLPNPAFSVDGLAVALLALLCGAYHLAFAWKEPETGYILAFLACMAEASGLLTWRLLPFPINLADALAPFLMVTAAATFWLASQDANPEVETQGGPHPSGSLPPNLGEGGGQHFSPLPALEGEARQKIAPLPELGEGPGAGANQKKIKWATLWREPLAGASLVAMALSIVTGLVTMLTGAGGAQRRLSLIPVVVGAGLAAAAQRRAGTEPFRRAGVAALAVAMALEMAMVCGLHAGIEQATTAQSLAWGVSLTALGAFWWILAQILPRWKQKDVWSGDFTAAGVATLFVATLVTGLTVLAAPSVTLQQLGMANGCLAAAFAVLMAQSWRHKQDAVLPLTVLTLLIAGAVNALRLPINAPFGLSACTVGALLASGVYIALARRLEKPEAALLSGWPLAVGLFLTLTRFRMEELSDVDGHLTDALWCIGGASLAWGYAVTARWSEKREFVTAAALTLTASYLNLFRVTLHPEPVAYGLILLPLLVVLYLVGTRATPETDALFGTPLRSVARTLAMAGLIWTIGWGDGLILQEAARQTGMVTLTLAVYGATAVLMTLLRATAKRMETTVTLVTAAYLHALLARAGFFGANDPMSGPRFAFFAVQASLAWVTLGWYVMRGKGRAELAAPMLTMAGRVAALSALVGLLTVMTPDEGRWTILTLGWAGAVWFALWLLEQGERCIHIGVWNLLAAWILIVHDQVQGDLTMLDIYLLPVGIYLLVVGHASCSRQKTQEAHSFWWAGLLMLMSPAFLAYWNGESPLHTVLLLLECLFAVLWGVAQRIRAFVCAGLGFASAYAGSQVIGHLPEFWGTFAALFLGVGLFVFGFYALTNRERLTRLMSACEARWNAWVAWR